MTETIKKRFIIVQRPGMIPDLKKPLGDDHEAVIRLLGDLHEVYPDAGLTLAELTWNDELRVSGGQEVLSIHDAMRKKPQRRVTGQKIG